MYPKILLPIFLLTPIFTLAQVKDSTEFAGQKNPWIQILDLNYDNVETIETAVSERLSEGTTSKLFVFAKNNEVRYFNIFTPDKNSNRSRSIKEKKMNSNTEKYYLHLLKEVRQNNFFDLVSDSLNITNDGQRIVKIKSGKTFRLRYIGYDYYKDYNTYAPERYIQNRIPGWQQRQKMLNLIASFNKEVSW